MLKMLDIVPNIVSYIKSFDHRVFRLTINSIRVRKSIQQTKLILISHILLPTDFIFDFSRDLVNFMRNA